MRPTLASCPSHAQVVTSGTGIIDVTYLTVPLFQGVFNTCGASNISLPLGVGQIDILALPCPTVSGGKNSMTIQMNVTIPAGVPGGAYEIILTSDDQDKKSAFCIDITLSL